MAAAAICPMCEEPGIHADVDACLVDVRAALAAVVQRLVRTTSPETFRAAWIAYGRARGLCA